jgi:hypothetical protein
MVINYYKNKILGEENINIKITYDGLEYSEWMGHQCILMGNYILDYDLLRRILH